LPRETDNSDDSSTLPLAELNPLLNPLLGQNMGRWAEVYFTSAPERREQAILELLHELEAEQSVRADAAVHPPGELSSAPESSPASAEAEVQPELVVCHACGQENSTRQRFCGMCGAPLREEATTEDAHLADLPQYESPAEQAREAQSFPPRPVVAEPTLPLGDTAIETYRQMFSNPDRKDRDRDSPSASGPYRAYVGAALAVVLLTFAYVAWRATRATPVDSRAVPKAATGGQIQPAATAPSSSTLKPDKSNQVTSNQVAPFTPAPTATSTETQGVQGSGSGELATAQSYLNGTNGQHRDTAKAAEWLWKAVAKQNGEATLLLSDLYLKGDGVAKNCDQARILLNAAARKGVRDSEERMSNLQAFGCQ